MHDIIQANKYQIHQIPLQFYTTNAEITCEMQLCIISTHIISIDAIPPDFCIDMHDILYDMLCYASVLNTMLCYEIKGNIPPFTEKVQI